MSEELLRPIDKLSEMVGPNGLIQMDRLRREADRLEKQYIKDGVHEWDRSEVNDRRKHADLIAEIHRLSNPDFSG